MIRENPLPAFYRQSRASMIVQFSRANAPFHRESLFLIRQAAMADLGHRYPQPSRMEKMGNSVRAHARKLSASIQGAPTLSEGDI